MSRHLVVDEGGLVLYVRSLPPEPRPDLRDVGYPFGRIFGWAPGWGTSRAHPPTNAPKRESGPPEVPAEQSRCAQMTLDIARRMGRPVRVVDVTVELAPRDVVETPEGEPAFFPILVRPDGARLSGESDFTPGGVRRFLEGH